MANVIQPPRGISTIEAPQDRFKAELSPADAAAPYSILSKTLDKVGDGLEQVSVQAAEQAGSEAVRKDDAGNLVVDRLPIIGPAGAAFKRAAHMTYLAQTEPEIENKATKMRLNYPNDPDGFKQAWGAYSDQFVNNPDRPLDPTLQPAVTKILAREGGQNYRSALVSADTLNTQNAAIAYKNSLTQLDNQGAALARQGGTNTPEYQAVQESIKTLYGELGTDPRFKYPQERIDQEVGEMVSRHKGEAVIGGAMGVYDKAAPTSAAEARKYLLDKAYDPSLNLSTAQRQQIVTRGMGALDGRTSANKSDVDANRKLVGEMIEGLKTTAPYDARRVNDQLQKSVALGDVESYYKLATYQSFHEWRASIRALPLQDQLDAVRSMRQSGTLVDRIAAAESNGNPVAQASTSSALGAGQFIRSTWVDLVKRTRPDLAVGQTDNQIAAMRTDPSLSKEMIANYAEQNRQQLEGAGVRTDNGALYLAHFLGPADAIRVLKSQPGQPVQGVVNSASIQANASIFARNPNAASLVGWAERKVGFIPGMPDESKLPQAAKPWVEAVRQEAVNDVTKNLGAKAEAMVGVLETAIGKNRAPGDQEINDIAQIIHDTGRTDLIERVDTALKGYEVGQAVTKQPVALRQAFRSQLQTLAADKSDPKQRRVIDTAEEVVRNTEAGMTKTPYSTGAQRGLHGPAAPLVFDDPNALAGAVDQRAGFDSIHQNHDGTPSQSVFEGDENQAFRGAMARGDAKVVTGTFAALQRLNDDQLAATLDDNVVKDGVLGAMRTTDPAKYTAVMSSLDALYARSPQTFVKLMGEDAWHSLKTWQSNTRYMDAETLAKERARVDDPQVRSQREHNEIAGHEIARKATPDDVVKAFDNSWSVTPGPIARATGSQPLAPVDPGTRDALMGDYDTIFARRYAETRDENAAKQQTVELLKTKWARSDVNGGRLMLRPPETVYPAVGGSYDWMRKQIETDLASTLGARVSANAEVGEATQGLAPIGGSNNWDYAIVSDRRTETEAQASKPPSYVVLVRDNRKATPTWDVMKAGPSGAQVEQRYSWDVSPELNKARTNFDAERRRVLADQDALAAYGVGGGL